MGSFESWRDGRKNTPRSKASTRNQVMLLYAYDIFEQEP